MELLADPNSRDQLRQFITSKRTSSQAARSATAGAFAIRRSGGQVVRATIVPKAKAA